ncbi:hypothetical protein BY458DRAFT_496958 [Sporodiniella umbellata]|nr:hypothetical protein BY458DRAFT_496958 [Sporodiniella umbellata]
MASEPCPLCDKNQVETEGNYDIWLQCDVCSDWYHSHCLKIELVDLVEKFHCPGCEVKQGPTTYRTLRKTDRSFTKLNYADLNEGTSTGDERIWQRVLQAKTFAPNAFPRYRADQVDLDLFRKTGLREPCVIEKNGPGLGMTMPTDLSVQQIADWVGRETEIEVMDVATQAEITGWTLGRWADYFSQPVRDRIRNVISLEISGTVLAEKITRPQVVRDMDWVDLVWPKQKMDSRPKVQLYCLMGTKDSYTDFHIDFGGSSVFYHVLSGQKTFYLIEPTSKNLKKYQKWSSSPDQSSTFFGDLVKECFLIELNAGHTMFIPTGWIHSVYTNQDAIVIGGNFLHSLNTATQLRVYQIEQATQIPSKFRFPYYQQTNWYALEAFDRWLTENQQTFSYFELESMAVLALFFSQHPEEIPERVKHPLALTERVLEQAKLALLSSAIDLPKATQKKSKKSVKTTAKDLQEEAWHPEPVTMVSSKRKEESSDEEMGTQRTSSKPAQRKKRKAALVHAKVSTVKQRLLERMSNKRH